MLGGWQPSSPSSGSSRLTGIPQEEVTRWVSDWLGDDAAGRRLLSVYASAGVAARASVVPIEQVFHPGDFETQNDVYREIAGREGAALVRRALATAEIAAADVGLDRERLLHRLPDPGRGCLRRGRAGHGPAPGPPPHHRERVRRGRGRAGARPRLPGRPSRTRWRVVLALEFASLTFQRWDRSATNVVSTAIFGDGGAAVVLAGADHPRGRARRAGQARVVGRGERVLPGHDAPHGLPPAQPGAADHPRPRAGPVRAQTRGRGGGRASSPRAGSAART